MQFINTRLSQLVCRLSSTLHKITKKQRECLRDGDLLLIGLDVDDLNTSLPRTAKTLIPRRK